MSKNGAPFAAAVPQIFGSSEVVRVTNGLAKAVIQLIAVYDDLLRMDGLDGPERNGEVTGVLDVDDQLGHDLIANRMTWHSS